MESTLKRTSTCTFNSGREGGESYSPDLQVSSDISKLMSCNFSNMEFKHYTDWHTFCKLNIINSDLLQMPTISKFEGIVSSWALAKLSWVNTQIELKRTLKFARQKVCTRSYSYNNRSSEIDFKYLPHFNKFNLKQNQQHKHSFSKLTFCFYASTYSTQAFHFP